MKTCNDPPSEGENGGAIDGIVFDTLLLAGGVSEH